ncbi:hypothetical protein QWM81_19550 [Streptomyces ficellus]|uniref:Uncharacterized protein n=1 Tax=Streptomyces ficellus TaxID=1977088 RepID=A0ABT7Z9V0_9ACTN|nr:hypothetical protein [Streptomyces ficellus]MDN3296215.1 hypothetical protein [Streptomyces ficellus]
MSRTSRKPPTRLYALGALSALLLWTTAAAHATPSPQAPAPAQAPTPVTHCAPGGTLRGAHGQYADIALCVTHTGATMTVMAAATCRRDLTGTRPVCRTSGTWTAHRDGSPTAEPTSSGTLAGRADYPGPGAYRISAAVHVRSTTPGIDLRGQARGTLTLTEAAPPPTHRVEVTGGTLKPGTSTTLTYTVSRVSDHGDGSARLGLIGEEATGIRVVSSDTRCVNPLPGRYPSTTRSMYALDCALTDLQPGRPATVTVRATLKATCSTLVSKLGYWTPKGQQTTGGMLTGPTVTCKNG